MNTHISYKTAKMLKEFMGESAPEPIDGIYIKVGVCSNGPSYPRYALHDLLSKPFCEAFAKAVDKRREFQDRITWQIYQRVTRQLCARYWKGGMEAVEKALVEMMENK